MDCQVVRSALLFAYRMKCPEGQHDPVWIQQHIPELIEESQHALEIMNTYYISDPVHHVDWKQFWNDDYVLEFLKCHGHTEPAFKRKGA